MTSFSYFDINRAIRAHDKIIEISGGHFGINHIGLIESVLEHVQNDDYYPTLVDKLTHIVFSFAMNHAFADGNKRSAIALGGFFMEINGYDNRVGTFIVEMENIVLWLAQKRIDKNFLHDIIESIIEHGEFTEEVKLKLFQTLEK